MNNEKEFEEYRRKEWKFDDIKRKKKKKIIKK